MTRPRQSPWDEPLFELIDSVSSKLLGRADLRGGSLARAVKRVSEAYLRQQGSPLELRADREALCARLKFFLPRDLPKIMAPLAELAAVSACPARSSLRVLDLGVGLGTTSLGLAEFAFTLPGVTQIEVDALDCDPEALAIAAELAAGWAHLRGKDLRLRTRCGSLDAAALSQARPPYDLIVLGFVLNELGDRQRDPVSHHCDWLQRCSELLSADGALIVLEPALRAQSRTLQEVRTRLALCPGPPYVFAPCLHQAACPLLARDRDWCHEQLALSFPARLAAIARDAGLRSASPTFSYLTLHRAPRSLRELDAGARLQRIVSGALPGKGKLEFLVCGEGGELRIRRLDRHASASNRPLSGARRGDVLRVSGPRLTDAGVLQVTEHTFVERLPGPSSQPGAAIPPASGYDTPLQPPETPASHGSGPDTPRD
jgi:ribosomal protein RSM22 (predicted rRNA methylase)